MEKTNIKQKITKLIDFLYCNKIDKKSYYFDVYWTDGDQPELFSEYLDSLIRVFNVYGCNSKIIDVNNIKPPFYTIEYIKEPYNMKRFVVNCTSLGQFNDVSLVMIFNQLDNFAVNEIRAKPPKLGECGIIIKDNKYIPLEEHLLIFCLYVKIHNFFHRLYVRMYNFFYRLHFTLKQRWKSL